MTAEWTTEIGALRLPRTSQPVPEKSRYAEPSCSLISTLSCIWMYSLLETAECSKDWAYRGAVIEVVDGLEDVRSCALYDVLQEVSH